MSTLAPQLIVEGTLWALLGFSLLTWTVIIAKTLQYIGVSVRDKRYAERFWQASHLGKAAQIEVARAPLHKIARAGFDALSTLGCDAGGLGITIVDELNDRHGFMIRAAEKSKKGSYIEVLNDDLLMGHIKVRADDPIIAEWAKLQWETEDRKQEDRRMPNHDADASLYAWRECKHYLHSDPVRVPRIGDKDFAAHEERRMEDLDIEQLTVKTDQPWWEQITS